MYHIHNIKIIIYELRLEREIESQHRMSEEDKRCLPFGEKTITIYYCRLKLCTYSNITYFMCSYQ